MLGWGNEDAKPQPLFWSLEQGKGRVFVSIPGHYSWSFDDPLFRVLLLRGIAWTAREPVDRPLTGLFLAVSGIEGYAMVAFDAGGASNPWDASHSEYAYVQFPKWRDAHDLMAGGVQITEVDGRQVRWPGPVGDAEFEKPFFRAGVAVLEQAQAAGAFEPLARAASFAVGVEATLGEDGRVWRPKLPRSRR